MRIPVQDIPILNNHPVNFERRIWPKSHPRAASILAKIHGRFSSRRFEFDHSICLLRFLAILNIIAWVLLASAGVMIARYFDTVWPEYERRVVVDGSGVATERTVPTRRRVPYFAVRPSFFQFFSIHEYSSP